MNNSLPDYITKTVARPQSSRAPWFANTAPTYAGIFLWIGFYQAIATGTLNQAGLGISLIALVIAALLCFGLYYYAPGRNEDGVTALCRRQFHLRVRGGYLLPGLLMGALQVAGSASLQISAATFLLKGIGIARNASLRDRGHHLGIRARLVWRDGHSVRCSGVVVHQHHPADYDSGCVRKDELGLQPLCTA